MSLMTKQLVNKSVKNCTGFNMHIEWGSLRNFPINDEIIQILKRSNDIDTLCIIGFSFPPTQQQDKTFRSLMISIGNEIERRRPKFTKKDELGIMNYLFEVSEVLNSAYFQLSGDHLKRIYLCLTILGTKNQRPGGYTLKDIMELGNIERRNRTLARIVVNKMESHGLLKRKGGIGKQPRYIFVGEETEETLNPEVLRESKENINAFSNLLGKKRLTIDSWETYNGGSTVLGSITDFCDFIIDGGMSGNLEGFFDLWPAWIGLLFELLSNPDNEDSSKLLQELYSKSALREKIKKERLRFDKDQIAQHISDFEWKGYMLIDLKNALNTVQRWNWPNDHYLRNLYIDTASTTLLQKKSSCMEKNVNNKNFN